MKAMGVFYEFFGDELPRAVNVQSLQPEIAQRNYQNTAYSRIMERDNWGKMEDVWNHRF